MKRILFLLGMTIPFFLQFPLYGTNDIRLPDVRSMGLGGNGVTQSSLINPALLSLTDSKYLSFQYHNKYGLKELSTVTAAFIYPNKLLPVGVCLSSFGCDLYREHSFRLSLGKQLGKQWAIGVCVQYFLLQTTLYSEEPSLLSVDTGITFLPSEQIQLGLVCMHWPTTSLNDKRFEGELFYLSSLQVGFSWKVIPELLLTGTIVTDNNKPITASAGIEYTVFGSFYLRSGIQASPLLPAFGVGYNYLLFTIDAAVSSHPLLGVNTGIGLTVTF